MSSAKDVFAARVAAMNSARDNKRSPTASPAAPSNTANKITISPGSSPATGGPRNTSIRRGSPSTLSASAGAAPKATTPASPKPPATVAPTGDLGADEWKKLYENEVKSRQMLEHDREIKENEIRLLNERLSSSGSGNDGNMVRELSVSKAELRNVTLKLENETRKRESLEAEVAKLKAGSSGSGSRESSQYFILFPSFNYNSLCFFFFCTFSQLGLDWVIFFCKTRGKISKIKNQKKIKKKS